MNLRDCRNAMFEARAWLGCGPHCNDCTMVHIGMGCYEHETDCGVLKTYNKLSNCIKELDNE